MKNRYKYFTGLAIIGFSVIFGGCQKNFLDINTDPNNPTDLPLTQILPAAEGGLTFNLCQNVGGINSATSTFVHQIVNSRVNDYVIDGTNFQNAWGYAGGSYGVFPGVLYDLQTVINKGTAQNAPHYVGVAQVQKAYVFSLWVDLFGDVPYFDALKGNDDLKPKYDASSAIYDDLFVQLDNAITNLSAASSSLSPDVNSDLIYGGDRTKWIRLANSIKLKLYNQVRLKRNVTAQINALIAGNNLISAEDQDFQLKFGTSSSPENRNIGFFANYGTGQRESFVSPFFYTILKNSADPRMPYYIYNQLTPTGNPTNPVDFRDGRFLSVRFASKGPNRNQDQRTFQSLVGLFPVGGRYDNGTGGAASLTSGPGDAPVRVLTSYQVKFIQAEAALTIGTTGAADALLRAAMVENFAKINKQAAAVPGSVQTVPSITDLARDTYINAIMANYAAATTTDAKLNIIMTQKWIASFGYGMDAYTDYRRTGFPAIPNTTGAVDPEMVSIRTFPFRLPYPNSEQSSNPNFPGQPDIYGTAGKIFWSN
ncbi:SusD/RagB family nutrient-binding outer membrane lipoprotein [Pedobacter africanus]|uniref:Starch-binding associating with outer membrane n=1 Tax=Pedobacter africanus TaxID=151894 RepID=A0A1W2BD38_9SPHI|nr:SusD/RagB family nutrient-binding outer membrane lipoprotein [Pedobacter africanus]SMC70308.1 Starch-binding associating with outer membrane [Pedobacter africanus]